MNDDHDDPYYCGEHDRPLGSPSLAQIAAGKRTAKARGIQAKAAGKRLGANAGPRRIGNGQRRRGVNVTGP